MLHKGTDKSIKTVDILFISGAYDTEWYVMLHHAMIDVGDDGYISEVLNTHGRGGTVKGGRDYRGPPP